ncbi:MAG: TIGR02206 family membrane protein [Terracidiphilus sp.]
MDSGFHLFGAVHIAILGATVLLAAVLAALQRRLTPGSRGLRLSFAAILILETAYWDIYQVRHGLLVFPTHLPLEFCDFTMYLSIVTLITLRPQVFDLAYYGAMAGSAMALLTPDLSERFPSVPTVQFFVGHGLAVATALYVVWSGLGRPRKGSVVRAMLGVNVLAALDGTLDWAFRSNYMYLRTKPGSTTLLDVLGPWPWYILAAEGVALVLFLLLYLPFRLTTARVA